MGKTAKVTFLGMKGVGKTAILEQAIYGNINKNSVSVRIICSSIYLFLEQF